MLYLVIIGATVLARLLPHVWNVAPVTAIAIFAGVYLPKKHALILPLLARFISDAIIGFFAWPLMLAVYAAHLGGALVGFWVRQHKSFPRIISAPILSAVIFFLLTNFALFYPSADYPRTFMGIIQAYVNGLPFFRGTLVGDSAYSWALIGAGELVLHYRKFRQPISGLSKI